MGRFWRTPHDGNYNYRGESEKVPWCVRPATISHVAGAGDDRVKPCICLLPTPHLLPGRLAEPEKK